VPLSEKSHVRGNLLKVFFASCLSSWLCPATIGVVIVLDQVSKLWIRAHLMLGQQSPVVDGFLNLIYTMNRGIAFGFFSGNSHPYKTVLLTFGAVVAVFVFSCFAAYYGGNRRSVMFAVSLLIGGTVGNLIDRMSYGAVIDFVDVHYKHLYHWPAFNVADTAVTLATLILLARIITMSSGKSRKASTTKSPSD